VHTAIQSLELLFGRGDDDYALWVLTVRLNILAFLFCTAFVIRRQAPRLRNIEPATWVIVFGLTALAAVLRLVVASANLADFGGIPYSRLLYGYKGYLATAQFFSPLYQLSTRDIEHGILFQRIIGTLTVALVYALCRQVSAKSFATITAFLFAVYPLHIFFSASDLLAVFATFLAACSYLCVVSATEVDDRRAVTFHYTAGFCGLALLTQVRPESSLLLVPAALYLAARRRELRWRDLGTALAVSGVFASVYAYHAMAAGLSHQNPVDVDRGLNLTIQHLALNPFTAIPVLFMAGVLVGVFRGMRWTLLAVVPWLTLFVACVLTVEDGHGAARIYANWLLLVLPFAGYGLSLMWSAPHWTARFVAAAVLAYLAALPIVTADRLTTPYLEIIENDRFKALLAAPPPDVERIVVPDDELMWRQYHSTLEVYRKYEAIFATRPPASRGLQLVRLTDYLAEPQRSGCSGGSCIFFFGIPCMDQDMYAVTRGQCETLLREHRASLLSETTVVAAPFVACSIYTGELRRELCDPATKARVFKVYRLD